MKAVKFFTAAISTALVMTAVICVIAVLFPNNGGGARAVSAEYNPRVLSASEENLVARLICAETGDKSPFICKVAVASVVLNRIADKGYPDNAVNVVFASGAFESVSTGEINREMSDAELTDALRALRLAVSDRDPTSGALLFAHSKSERAEMIRITFSAGDMLFGLPA